MATMGYREYARHRGVSLGAVQKAIKVGRIQPVEVEGKPKIDSDQADRDWTENTDPAKQSLLYSAGPTDSGGEAEAGTAAGEGVAKGAGRVRQAAPSNAREEEEDAAAPVDEDLVAYRRERAAREAINRARDQLALDKDRGKLVDREEVARLRFTEFRALRDALMNLGPRVAPLVAVESDVVRCETLYVEALEEVLNAFADQVLTRDVLQEEGDDDDADDD